MLLNLHPLVELSIWVAFLLGGFICIVNFSLPVRYYLNRWHKLPEDHYVSPIPILGSLIVFLTLRVLGQIPATKVAGIILIAIDVGGIHWMIFGIGYQLCRSLHKKFEKLKVVESTLKIYSSRFAPMNGRSAVGASARGYRRG